MPEYRVSCLISLAGGGSFSETYETNADDLPLARIRIINYCAFRRDYIPNGSLIKGWRVGRIRSTTREADSGQLDFKRPGSVNQDNNRDFAGGGIVIKLRTSTRKSTRTYRGLPDDLFQWGDAGGFAANAQLEDFREKLQEALIANNFGGSFQSTDPADTIPTKIVSATISNNVLLRVESPSAVYVPGESAVIKGAKGPGASKLNGVYTVTGYDAGPPVEVSLSAKLVGSMLLQPYTATISHRKKIVLPFIEALLVRPGERKVGNKAFFLSPGRRSKRVSL